jgi:IS1 family transposase
MILKLSGACYAIRSMVPISDITTLKSIYFAYFHSIIKYGIIFWGNSSYSIKIFTLQKIIIRILADAQPRTSCRSLLKKLQILPVPCQYIQSIRNFVINNQEAFQTNSAIHNINTRNKHHLHRPNANLSCFKKSAYYAGIRIFKRLPLSLSVLMNDKAKFKKAVKKYLNTHSFYSVDDIMCTENNTVVYYVL